MAQKAARKATAQKAKRKAPAAAPVRPRRDVAIVQIDPKFATMKQWNRISGIGRTTTYKWLAEKKVYAVKAGSRLLIDVDAGLRRYLRSLPAPDIALPKTMADRRPEPATRRPIAEADRRPEPATRAVRQSESANA